MASMPSPGHNNQTALGIGGNINVDYSTEYVLFGVLSVVSVIVIPLVLVLVVTVIRLCCWQCREWCHWAVPEGQVRHDHNVSDIRRNRETLAPEEGRIGDDWECAICLEGGLVKPQRAIEKDDDNSFVVLRACQHAFHLPCIVKWIARNKSCPVCREVVDRLIVRSVGGEANTTSFEDDRGSSFALDIV